MEVINYVTKIKGGAKNVASLIEQKYNGSLPKEWIKIDSEETRQALILESTEKIKKDGKTEDKSWFKRIDHGEMIGDIACKYLTQMGDKKLGKMITELNNWLDNA